MIGIIFPNQLIYHFQNPLANEELDFLVLIEDPIFYGFRKKMKMYFNTIKLTYHQLSINNWVENESIKFDCDFDVIDYSKFKNNIYKKLARKFKSAVVLETVDHELNEKLTEAFGDNLKILPTPNFIASSEFLNKFNQIKTGAKYLHASFYQRMRVENDILLTKEGKPVGGKWSYDADNRKVPSTNIEIPKTSSYKDTKEVLKAKKEVGKKFGRDDLDFTLYFPWKRSQVLERINSFIEEKFENFGPYQDAIVASEDFLWHSVISAALNISIVQPMEIIEKVLEQKGNLSSKEGFIRQILGWREWSRYCYLYYYDQMVKPNFFKSKGKLSKVWYQIQDDLNDPIINTISRAWRIGYLHHIERLMIIANFMTILRVDPDEMYKWFMEFSVDSYDWVMINNVYGMGSYSDGGLTTTKPYISSSAYVLRMSNYKKGIWSKTWDGFYRLFIKENMPLLKDNPRMSMTLRSVKTPTEEELQLIKEYQNYYLES